MPTLLTVTATPTGPRRSVDDAGPFDLDIEMRSCRGGRPGHPVGSQFTALRLPPVIAMPLRRTTGDAYAVHLSARDVDGTRWDIRLPVSTRRGARLLAAALTAEIRRAVAGLGAFG